MKVSTEHYMLMKTAFDNMMATRYDDTTLKTLWESVKARKGSNGNPVILFASYFIDATIGAVSEAYKHYNDDHIFTALVKIMRKNPRISELMSN